MTFHLRSKPHNAFWITEWAKTLGRKYLPISINKWNNALFEKYLAIRTDFVRFVTLNAALTIFSSIHTPNILSSASQTEGSC